MPRLGLQDYVMTTSATTFHVAHYFAYNEYHYSTGSSINEALKNLGKPWISTEITVDSYDKEYKIHNGHMAYETEEYEGDIIDPMDSISISYDRTEEDDWDDILLAY